MLKLLLFVLVLFAVYWVPRLLRQKNSARQGGAPPRGRPAADAERMLPCARCGLHVPESDGVRRDEAFYCCEEHARSERS